MRARHSEHKSRPDVKQRKLCEVAVSAGNFWRMIKQDDMSRVINLLKKLRVTGVEFPLLPTMRSRKLSPSQEQWVKKRNHVSIHLPLIKCRNAKELKQAVGDARAVNALCKRLGVKNVVIHPDRMPPRILLPILGKGVTLVTENMEKQPGQTRCNFEKILEKYPEFGLCLDVCHAFMWHPKETARIVEKWGSRIKQIHFSNFEENPHFHFRKGNNAFVESIQPIKKLNIPIIIEEDIEPKNFKWLWKEIYRIRRMVS